MKRAPFFAIPLALFAAACTVGPNYRAPQLPTPPAYAEAASTPRLAITPADADLSRWWTQFGDPLLNALVTEALAKQPRYRHRRLSRSRGARTGDRGQRRRISDGERNHERVDAQLQPLLGVRRDRHTHPFARQSLFRRLRRHMGTGPVRRDAPVHRRGPRQHRRLPLGGARHAGHLVSEVANDYLTLRALQARIAVGQAELQRQKDLFTLIAARRKTGFVTNLDVNQQSTEVATAAAQIPQLAAQAKAQIHAIGVLLGQPPEALTARLAATGAALPPPPPTLPTGLPSELLRRRPDIRQAERRLAASNAEIGVQTANLYPKVNLIGLASFAGTSLDSLFSHQNLTSIGVAMASVPIFDAGKTRASIRVAREENRCKPPSPIADARSSSRCVTWRTPSPATRPRRSRRTRRWPAIGDGGSRFAFHCPGPIPYRLCDLHQRPHQAQITLSQRARTNSPNPTARSRRTWCRSTRPWEAAGPPEREELRR